MIKFTIVALGVIPSETERECYELVSDFLDRADRCLRDLESYGAGATDAIREVVTVQFPSIEKTKIYYFIDFFGHL